MKYNTIKVLLNGKTWEVSCDKTSTMDRKEIETFPHDMGFYHYPETMSDEVALKKLLNSMIKRHEEEISCLTESKNGLNKLLAERI